MPHEGRGCGRHMEDSPHGGSHAANPAASSKATQVVFASADRFHSTAPGPEASGSMMTTVDGSAGEKLVAREEPGGSTPSGSGACGGEARMRLCFIVNEYPPAR